MYMYVYTCILHNTLKNYKTLILSNIFTPPLKGSLYHLYNWHIYMELLSADTNHSVIYHVNSLYV